jgi:TolA-binding protein
MDTDTTKVMQDALQAAVTRLNTGQGAEPRASPATDTFGTLMSFVPRLLQNNEAGGQMLEKLDALRKGELTTLKGDVLLLRKQCYRVFKQQEHLLQRLEDLQKQQTAVGQAVLEMAQQMARITFVDGADDDDDEEWDSPPARESPRRGEARTTQKKRGPKAATTR